MSEPITTEQAVQMIADAKKSGKIFTVKFFKRTTGEFRVMNCRGGVYKDLSGGDLRFNPSDHRLIPVFDMQKCAYRMVNCETIQEITIHGKTHRVSSSLL
jgi:hypothetical protein